MDSKGRRGQSQIQKPRMQTGDPLEKATGESTTLLRAPSGNVRRIIVVKSEPVAVTTQETGIVKNAMRIVSVEQVELGNIMELPITDQVLRWARQSNLSGGVSRSKVDGWIKLPKNHNHLTGTCASWLWRSGKVRNEESAVQC